MVIILSVRPRPSSLRARFPSIKYTYYYLLLFRAIRLNYTMDRNALDNVPRLKFEVFSSHHTPCIVITTFFSIRSNIQERCIYEPLEPMYGTSIFVFCTQNRKTFWTLVNSNKSFFISYYAQDADQ